MKHSKHIWRVVIILIGVGVFVVSGRSFMLPSSFGQAGHFRYDSISEYMAKPLRHGGDASCEKCHEKNFALHETGKHQTVRCEVCHGALSLHVVDGKKVADARVPRKYEWCAICHQAQPAKPAGFPTINIKDHLATMTGSPVTDPIDPAVCLGCHNPHDPLPGSSDAPAAAPAPTAAPATPAPAPPAPATPASPEVPK